MELKTIEQLCHLVLMRNWHLDQAAEIQDDINDNTTINMRKSPSYVEKCDVKKLEALGCDIIPDGFVNSKLVFKETKYNLYNKLTDQMKIYEHLLEK